MKHYRPLRRILSFAVCLVLLCGLGLSAHAAGFQYPAAYWPTQTAWEKAVNAKDLAAMADAAAQTYNVLMPLGKNTITCANLEFKCGWAALYYESIGDFENAILWLTRQQELCQWLEDNGTSRYDTLVNIKPRLAFLEAALHPTIYALADGASSPYPVGPKHGTLYGSTTAGGKTGESAVLAYVHFLDGYSMEYWLSYFQNIYPTLKTAATQGGVIELAWNFSPENTDSVRKVLDPANDAYISESLKTLSQLNATVILRFGAEMNVWAADCDPATYREAYRKVATEARKYGNIQMSWSPGDVGNQKRTWDDYWPGDEYVDWVGMSSYRNNAMRYMHMTTTPATYSGYVSQPDRIYTDAYYGQGVYASNPLIASKSLIDFAAAHNKPVMISECGFGYYDKKTGTDQTASAAELLTQFYSYINMVYPQVKAVFYFNDVTEVSKAYAFRLDQSPVMDRAYETVTKNGSYLAFGQTAGLNWTTLDKVSYGAADGKLKLATYAAIPGSKDAVLSVSYLVDGKQVASSSSAPFTCELNVAALSAGSHTVQAVVTSRDGSRTATVKSAAYTISVAGDGYVKGAAGAARTNAIAAEQVFYADGIGKDFYTYQIGGHNYVKLRDLATALNGSQGQFSVDYDYANNCITLDSGKPYQPVGGEMAKPSAAGDQPYLAIGSTLIINGKEARLEAYAINGNNYFQLRDLGRALGFNVSYINSRVVIATDEPYSDAQ